MSSADAPGLGRQASANERGAASPGKAAGVRA